MSAIRILVLLVVTTSLASALDEPCASFVRHIAGIATRQNVNQSTWTGGATYKEPPGGQVYRAFYDFDEDGIDDLILLSSVNVPKASIFKGKKHGYADVTDDAVFFNLEFTTARKSGTIEIMSLATTHGFARIAKNIFKIGGGFKVEIRDFNFKPPETVELGKLGVGTVVLPKRIEKITLMELVLSPRPKWQKADGKLYLPGQSYEISKDLAISPEPFTPDFARNLLGRAKN